MKYEVSIIVVTYYPDYKKLLRTLRSIIIQKEISFEIIIADDGTENFCENLIEEWLKKQGVIDYHIIGNVKNQGTVANIYSAIKEAKGDYIKVISPGDMLYDEYVLTKTVNYLKNTNQKVCFGKAIWYAVENNRKKYELFDISAPKDIEPYIKQDFKCIQKNYLMKKDYVLGATFIVEKILLKEYLERIVGHIIYAEDCAFVLMIADGIELGYFDDYFVWYEYGSGISTSGNARWGKRLYDDNEKCFSIIKEQHPEWEKAYNITFGKKTLTTYLLKAVYFIMNKVNCHRNTKAPIRNIDYALLEKLLFSFEDK